MVPSLLDYGYLFVWVEREYIAEMIRAAEGCAFKYVENLCWIWRDGGNRLIGRPHSMLLMQSKMTLMILKRDAGNKVKLRHQRNSDCIFDFFDDDEPGRRPDFKVYDMIETLLIGPSNEKEKEKEKAKENGTGEKVPGTVPYLLHLWANPSATDRLISRHRSDWIRVSEPST